jgi:predicted PurR-regulated permease PerM
VLLVYFVLLLAAAAGGVVSGFVAVDQVARLAATLPDLVPQAIARGQALFEEWSARVFTIGPYSFEVGSLIQWVDLNALAEQANALIQPTFSRGGYLVAQVAQTTLSTLTISFLVFTLSIYLSRDAPKIGRVISDLAHQPGYRQDADRLMRDIVAIWDAYLRGQVTLGLVMATVVSIVLGILGVNNALALGLLSGILEFLPVIGPLIGIGAAVLVAIFQDVNRLGLTPMNYALVVLAAMIIIQQLENGLLVPRIVGDALDLHPLVVMVSVIMGASLAGILGAVLAAPVVASIKLLGAYAWRKMWDLPPFPEPAPPPEPALGNAGNGGLWMRLSTWLAKFAPKRR